jgi:hypothetical protein
VADPVITSAALDKASYAPGETMVLTVRGHDLDEQTFSVDVRVRNRASGATSETLTVTAVVDELEATADDSSGRVWTQQSRTGDTFVLTATA